MSVTIITKLTQINFWYEFEEGRRKNCLWIVNDLPLRVYKLQTILSTPVDGGVLNLQKKR
ncbi:hypothetical protein [Okeania sp. KiyG1]|uniref:hypothetical protein n=1 Tax=Okeania sp. KiyG1 TaxID=2720165 RepID=UPI00192091B3|nr:hypothetical protein [Okeania sp. KiyG1]